MDTYQEDWNDLEIYGCKIINNFISEEEEKLLLHKIDNESWDDLSLKRRVQHYGYKYDYKSSTLDSFYYLGKLPDWSDFLVEKWLNILNFIPDQLIVNEYIPGQGISKHIDNIHIFGEYVVSVSLGSDIVMNMSYGTTKKSFLLKARTMLILSKDARWKWAHDIPSRKVDKNITDSLTGNIINLKRGRRVSITFRKVKM
jgi:alkylated DNA repair dioxygenase AlkB